MFSWIWFFGGGAQYRNKIKNLEAERKEFLKEREILYKSVDSLSLVNNELIIKDLQLKIKIDVLNQELEFYKKSADKSKRELEENRLKLAETRKQIKELKENPLNRTGYDLINSLKQKVKK